MNYKRLFFDWLQKQGALEVYKKNFKNCRLDNSFTDVFPQDRLYRDYIIGAFSWIGTPEGFWYWRALQYKWYLIFDKYKHKNFNS